MARLLVVIGTIAVILAALTLVVGAISQGCQCSYCDVLTCIRQSVGLR
jgi:hypothetical protein